MIQVEGLTKDYGLRRAIDDLTFTVNQGEIVGFLGPNGAGKTTTMRILSGYLPPSAGKASVAGFDIIEQSLEARRKIGYLPETVPLYPDMTVFDYLKFMADLRHIPEAEDKVDEVLEMVHMEDRSGGYIGNLSKGMRQRIGLAQALIHEPEVLILDEPTIGLDPAQIHEVRNLIREIGKEKTVLLSTHILSEAQAVCNRVLIINKGKIVVEDRPEDLQARLAGGRRIAVRIAGEVKGLDELVVSIPGVSRVVEVLSNGIDFETTPGQDVRPEVARKIVSSGFDLLELKPLGLSLEEIFLELTKEQESQLDEELDDEEEGEEEEQNLNEIDEEKEG